MFQNLRKSGLSLLNLILISSFLIFSKFVYDRSLFEFDKKAIAFIQSHTNIIFDHITLLFTIAGSGEVTGVISLFIAALLFAFGYRRASFFFLFYFGMSVAVELAFKFTIPQPKVFAEFRRGLKIPVPIYSPFTPYAYPSGHATRTVMLGGMFYYFIDRIGKIDAKSYAKQAASKFWPFWGNLAVSAVFKLGGYDKKKVLIRRFLKTALVIFIAAMLVSRVYEGAHWPCDVIGGVFLGGFMLSMALGHIK